jgi:hypothetical protein
MRDNPDALTVSASLDGIAAPSTGGGVIKRTFDAAAVNAIANHPEVRPWIGGEGELDTTETIANPANFALFGEGGGFMLLSRDQGIYEVHSLFLPEARRFSLSRMRAGLAYMFCQTDAFRLVTQVPDNHPAALALASKGGFRPWFRREDTPLGPSLFMLLDLDDWVQQTADLETDGHWFHDRIEHAKIAAQSDLPVHPDDPAHERAVGAAVRMIRAGNPGKGIATYNRWAASAGYAQITPVSFNPLVLDVVDALVTLNGAEMEVLQCR